MCISGKHPVQLFVIGIAIPILTKILVLASVLEHSQAFARSGSVLVAFTILVVFINHSNKVYLGRQEEILKEWGETPAVARDKSKESFYAELKEEMTEEEFKRQKAKAGDAIDRALGPGFDDYVRKRKEIMSKLVEETEKSTMNISIVEAALGIIGTLVWGFG